MSHPVSEEEEEVSAETMETIPPRDCSRKREVMAGNTVLSHTEQNSYEVTPSHTGGS